MDRLCGERKGWDRRGAERIVTQGHSIADLESRCVNEPVVEGLVNEAQDWMGGIGASREGNVRPVTAGPAGIGIACRGTVGDGRDMQAWKGATRPRLERPCAAPQAMRVGDGTVRYRSSADRIGQSTQVRLGAACRGSGGKGGKDWRGTSGGDWKCKDRNGVDGKCRQGQARTDQDG